MASMAASPFTRSLLVAALLSALGLALAGCGPTIDSRAYAPNAKDRRLAFMVPESELPKYSAARHTEHPIQGIDVSKYQGDINWQQVRDAGVRFAWIKATEGGDVVDSKFQANWEGARAAGIPRGAYHFMFWCRPWQEEANWFIRNVPVEPDALPPVLDVEATPQSKMCKRTLERDKTIADMRLILQELERHYGKKPVIYSSVDFYQSMLFDGALSEYPIWVRSTKYHPAVRYGNRHWHIWQYASDGSVPGIQGAVDRNAFYGSEGDWRRWLRGEDSMVAQKN
jgi:lysozyme